MTSADISSLQAWVTDHETEMLETLQDLIRIPSLESDPEPNAPFGAENRRALDYVLALAQKWGMKTKDLEGYGAWAEFGQGERLIGIFCHLDVVPVGPGWKFDPFGAVVDDGYLYGRGATDDKGPTVAAFYAARALQERMPDIPARIRVFFGCNEESGFKCIERYVQTEEAPTYGFAPDAGWPLYHAEKGIANLEISLRPAKGSMEVVSLEGGQRPNIVIDSAVGVVRVHAEAQKHVREQLDKAWDKNLSWNWDGDLLRVVAGGKAAHGSWPYGGDNAASRILRFWMEIAPSTERRIFEELLMTTHPGGLGLGIDGRDDVSDLTNNLGVVRTESGVVKFTFNIRYPVTWSGSDLRTRCEARLADCRNDLTLDDMHDSVPLYFPLEHPLVSTVVDVYEMETGERRKPGVMGGGTYARAVPNSVAIGTGWEGDGMAHETDERLKVAHLGKMSRIYAHILARLATV